MRSRTRNLGAYGLLLAAVGAAGVLAWSQVQTKAATPQTNTRTVTVQTGTVSQTVSATGNLESASSTNVSFQTSGKVIEVAVKPGQTVTAGQVLGKLDPTTATTNLDVAQLNYSAAAQKLTQAQAGTTTTGGAGGGSSATSSSTGTVDSAAVYSAQASLIQAQTSLDNAKAALVATTLVAPTAGLVTVVNNVVGDTAGSSSTGSSSSSTAAASAAGGGSGASGGAGGSGSAASATSSSSGAGFVTIIDPSSYQVKVAFPEADAVKVKVDQPASVTVDAIAGTTLTGKVASLDPLATVTSNVVTYKSVISVANPPATLKVGMTVTVAVTAASKENVVAVSTAAITTQGGSSFVTKLVNGTPTRTDVVVGLQGDSTTEITSGLVAGDQVTVATGTISTSNAQTGTGNRQAGGGAGGLGGGGFTGGGGGGGGFPGGGQRPGGG